MQNVYSAVNAAIFIFPQMAFLVMFMCLSTLWYRVGRFCRELNAIIKSIFTGLCDGCFLTVLRCWLIMHTHTHKIWTYSHSPSFYINTYTYIQKLNLSLSRSLSLPPSLSYRKNSISNRNRSLFTHKLSHFLCNILCTLTQRHIIELVSCQQKQHKT